MRWDWWKYSFIWYFIFDVLINIMVWENNFRYITCSRVFFFQQQNGESFLNGSLRSPYRQLFLFLKWNVLNRRTETSWIIGITPTGCCSSFSVTMKISHFSKRWKEIMSTSSIIIIPLYSETSLYHDYIVASIIIFHFTQSVVCLLHLSSYKEE